MRHQCLLVALIVGSIAGGESTARAQAGDRVIPIFEIAEEDFAEIDLKDGSADEWAEILGDPALTMLDFEICPFWSDIGAYDPSDFDFVMWLGWRRLTNHIYVAVAAADDRYVNEFGADADYGDTIGAWDSVAILIDGDHSGGRWIDPAWWGSDDDYKTLYNMQVQSYAGMALSQTGNHVIMEITGEFSEWMISPPYSDGGGGVVGEQPLIVVTEFYVTAFDHLDWTSQDDSEVSQLFPGKIIGINPMVVDRDGPAFEHRAMYAVVPLDADDLEKQMFAESFADAVLIGADGTGSDGSVVKADSWGRIKASLMD